MSKKPRRSRLYVVPFMFEAGQNHLDYMTVYDAERIRVVGPSGVVRFWCGSSSKYLTHTVDEDIVFTDQSDSAASGGNRTRPKRKARAPKR